VKKELIKEGRIIMKNSFQKFMLMLLALFLVLSPVSPVLAADEQEGPQPSLEKGDKKEDIQPGRGNSTDSSEKTHLERDRSWDEVNREVPAVKKHAPSEREERSKWDIGSDITENMLNIISVHGEKSNLKTGITLASSMAGIPVAFNQSNMTDGQKAGSDFALYSADVVSVGIEWSERRKDLTNNRGSVKTLSGLSKTKELLHKTSNLIDNTLSKGSSLLNSAKSAGKDLLKRSSLLSGAKSVGKDLLSKGSNLLSGAKSVGKDLLSKGSSLFNGAKSVGKDLLSKGSSLLSSAKSTGKDLLSKGSSLLSSAKSTGKDLLSKGSSLLSSAKSTGKDLLSKGSSLLSSAKSTGKDLLSKGSSLLSSAKSTGKDLLSKGSDLLSKGKTAVENSRFGPALSVAKNVASKGLGVLSVAGAIGDGFAAVDSFSSGEIMNGVGSTLGAIGGLAGGAAVLFPPAAGLALVATGASLAIKHRDVIKEKGKKAIKAVANGAKAAKDTVVNGVKSLGKSLGNLFS